jgi:hypothetical protein
MSMTENGDPYENAQAERTRGAYKTIVPVTYVTGTIVICQPILRDSTLL